MTCVVGVEHQGMVWMGADSMISFGDTCLTLREPKCFTVGRYVFGEAGSGRWGPLIRFKMRFPEPPTSGIERFVNTIVVPELKKIHDEEMKGDDDISTLLGVNGQLYLVDAGWCAVRSRGYAAIGCGADYALGSLHGASKRAAPKTRIKRALEAAEAHNVYVRRPWRWARG